MIFHDCFELRAYADRFINLGLGHARPMLDRRGCACGNEPTPLGDPGDGDGVESRYPGLWRHSNRRRPLHLHELVGHNDFRPFPGDQDGRLLVGSSVHSVHRWRTERYGDPVVAAAVLAQLNATTIPVNVTHFNGNPTVGSGTPADPVRPA